MKDQGGIDFSLLDFYKRLIRVFGFYIYIVESIHVEWMLCKKSSLKALLQYSKRWLRLNAWSLINLSLYCSPLLGSCHSFLFYSLFADCQFSNNCLFLYVWNIKWYQNVPLFQCMFWFKRKTDNEAKTLSTCELRAFSRSGA